MVLIATIMIVLAFWGLTRSTAHTAASIHQHIFHELPPHLVFVHTYASASAYTNVRANEVATALSPDYAALAPYRVEVDDLDEVKAKIPFEAYRTHPDPWDTGYQTVDHFLLAMYSKQRVTEMIQNSGITPTMVVFVRPDMRYLSSVRPLLEYAAPDAWVIPSFHLYSGFNDRFCIAAPSNYLVYGRVFDLLLGYSRKKSLHSETFYADWAKVNRIRIVYAPSSFVFQRVRLNGETDTRDLLLHEAVHHKYNNDTDARHVDLHNGIVRHMPVRHPFAFRIVHGVSPVRKPTGVVLGNVGVVNVPTFRSNFVRVVPR